MSVLTVMQFIVNIIIMIVLLTIMILGGIWLFKDKGQNQHSVLRNFPVLGRIRYISEKIGPELRQYFFANDNEGKPFSRSDYKNIVLAGKYKSRMTSFGTGKDYLEGFYIQNTMFPLQATELHIDHTEFISTFLYHIENERLFSREEYRKSAQVDPFFLTDEHAVVLGSNLKHPFKIKRLVGQSGMSYGALGKNAITALSMGLAKAGTWMNTGE
ncbi:MAG: glutamate synthase-related protein, partial [Staphylococcus epidermidis]|nr:glutamate synthase-related protein [Staphylococcus epidermidis]